MLVVERKVGESVFVGEDIEVRLVRVRPGGKVRLGFVCPESVRVYRSGSAEHRQRKGKNKTDSKDRE